MQEIGKKKQIVHKICDGYFFKKKPISINQEFQNLKPYDLLMSLVTTMCDVSLLWFLQS
jgi:hypothetical protein